MTTEKRPLPDWAEEIFNAICGAFTFKGFGSLEGFHVPSEETSFGVDLLAIAPALSEITPPGSEEPELAYGVIHEFDLLEVQDALDEVIGFSFGVESDGRQCFTIEGVCQEREVIVLIYTDPFGEGEGEEESLDSDDDDSEGNGNGAGNGHVKIAIVKE